MGNILRRSNGLDAVRTNKFAKVAGGFGLVAVLISGCSGGQSSPDQKPSISASPSTASPNTPTASLNTPTESPATSSANPEITEVVKIVKLPTVSNEGLYVTDTNQAQKVANSTTRGATTPVDPLVAALHGDGTFLDRMHVDINEVVLNYNLNALYLKQAGEVIDAAKGELPVHSTTYGFSTVTDNYDFTRATQYLLGELISQYKEGKQHHLDTRYPLCIGTTEASTVLPDGTLETGFFPPLGIASAPEESLCTTNDDITKAIIDQMPYFARTGVKFATDAGLPNIAKLFDIEANITNFRSLEAKSYFQEFLANVSVQ